MERNLSIRRKQSNGELGNNMQTWNSHQCLPKRRVPYSGGTLGRLTEIYVNYFNLNLDHLYAKTVYHYEVEYIPDQPKNLRRLILEEFGAKHYPYIKYAFDDHSSMYTITKIKQKSESISVFDHDFNRTVRLTVKIKLVDVVSMGNIKEYINSGSTNIFPKEECKILDVILQNKFSSLSLLNSGSSLFPVKLPSIDLCDGSELWRGFFQNNVVGWKPLLNIDVARKIFLKEQLLVTFIANKLNCNLSCEMDQSSLNELRNYVKGIKVHYEFPNQPNSKRIMKVHDVLDTAEKIVFDMVHTTEGTITTNVVQYFKTVRNYVIKYPNLPCLQVGNPKRVTAIPIELCAVHNTKMSLINFKEIQSICFKNNSTHSPTEQKKIIESYVSDIRFNKNPVLKEFGIEVEKNFISIPARVLDQPSLAYAQNKETIPESGTWTPDKFSKAVKLEKWSVLNMDRRLSVKTLKNFEKTLVNIGKNFNVDVSPMKTLHNHFDYEEDEFEDFILKFLKKQKEVVDIVIVVIPHYPSKLYGIIKQISDTQVGILTQCILSKTINSENSNYINNLLMKLNSKLNGINHLLSDKSSPPVMNGAIIFGAETIYSSSNFQPTIVAVTASYDLFGSQYSMEWRLQLPKDEFINDLENIVHKQLINFKDKTNVIPNKIIYFRESVSSLKYLQLLDNELVAIRRACLRIHPNYKLPITMISVTKQHHTKMFPKHSIDKNGKYGNVYPGTVIDTHITHPKDIDFYLCSHASKEGTSKPTKYNIVWDDSNLTEDEIEQLVFFLCFTHSRCARSISYPTPTLYAHLAASRVRSYTENKKMDMNNLKAEETQLKLTSIFTENSPMYYI